MIVHGITGNANNPLNLTTAKHLAEQGYAPFAISMRGSEGEVPTVPNLWSANSYLELKEALVKLDSPTPWKLLGFSLGANISLRLLQEQPEWSSKNISLCLAVSCPFDLRRCAENLESSPLKRSYRYYMVETLKKRALQFIQNYPNSIPHPHKLSQCRTFFDFDNTVICHLNGFRDAYHYWSTASTHDKLHLITTPTILFQGVDDPFLDPHTIPYVPKKNPLLRKVFQNWGGHVGFFHPQEKFWLEKKIVELLSDPNYA